MSCRASTPGSFDWHKDGRRLASAPSLQCFSAGHHQLQRSRPTADPAVPSSPTNDAEVHAPPHRVGLYPLIYDHENTYRTARAGDLGAGVAQKYFFSKALCTRLSRQLLIPRIALSALLAPYSDKPGTATGFPAPTTGR
jgi:hypothetical protein